MPNVVRVGFDASDEVQASEKIQRFRGNLEGLEAASVSSSKALSAAQQQYRDDLIKAGVASQRATEEAVKYEAASVSAAGAAAKAHGETAKAAELSAARQKAAAESLQRQRSASLIAEFKQEESLREQSAAAAARDAERARRASPQSLIANERQRLERRGILAAARANGELPEEEGGSSLRGQRALLRAGTRAAGLPSEVSQIGGLGLYGGGVAGIGLGIAAIAGIRELISLSADARKAELELALAARDTGQSFASAAADSESFRNSLIADREEAGKVAAAFGELKLKLGDLPSDAKEKFSTIATARGLSPDDTAKVLRELAQGGEAAKKAFHELSGRDANLFLDDYARAAHKTTSELTEATKTQLLWNELQRRSGEYTEASAQRLNSLDARIQSFKNSAKDALTILPALTFGASQGDIEEILGLKNKYDTPQTAQSAKEVQADEARLKRAAELQLQFEKYDSGRQRKNIESGIDKNPLAQLKQLEQEYASLKAVQNQVADTDFTKFGDKYFIEIHTAREQVKALQKEATAFADQLAARAIGNNPFVKLFGDGERAIENICKQFAPLGDEVVAQFVKMEKAGYSLETYSQRLKSNIAAVGLEFRAAFLEKNLVGISGEQQRQIEILRKRFEAATTAPNLQREAEAYRRGFLPQNQYQVHQDQMRDYEQVKRLRPLGNDEAARTAQKMIDDYILEKTKGLPINARFSPDHFMRELSQDRAGALDASAKRLQANIQDELKRAEVGRYGSQLANKQLEELSKYPAGSGPERDALRGEFLAITDKLNPNELTGALRKGVIDASREQATSLRQQEQEAKDFRKDLVGAGGILHQIKDVLQGKTGAASDTVKQITESAQSAAQAGIFGKVQSNASDLAKQITESAQSVAQAANAEMIARARAEAQANRFINPNAVGYDPSLNQISLSGDASEQDEQMKALVRAQSESGRRLVVDPVTLYTGHIKRGAVSVNQYSRDFFNARPNYNPANAPREFDANNPYQRAFSEVGFINSLRSSSYRATPVAQQATQMGDFVGVLKSLVANVEGLKSLVIKDGRLLVDSGPAATINISTKDLQTQQSTLGPAMTPESLQRNLTGALGIKY